MQQREIVTSTLIHDGTLKSGDFASGPSNVNNVKIPDLLESLVMLLSSSLCSHPKIICKNLQDFKDIHGGDSFFTT